ncbi:MAG: nucleotidyltransferase [Deltaproteobacteria bacterium]|nr:nucleotidyltransferase [Deltaproteobacteria bacterium]
MHRISIDQERLEVFCRRWKIAEFALFGSVLRDDFGPDSDVDVLVSFLPEAELKEILGHEVDLVSRRGIESSRNYIRKHAILSSSEAIYAA